jgi:hypothetical protein
MASLTGDGSYQVRVKNSQLGTTRIECSAENIWGSDKKTTNVINTCELPPPNSSSFDNVYSNQCLSSKTWNEAPTAVKPRHCSFLYNVGFWATIVHGFSQKDFIHISN